MSRRAVLFLFSCALACSDPASRQTSVVEHRAELGRSGGGGEADVAPEVVEIGDAATASDTEAVAPPTLGTFAEPILVDSFPFTDARDTRAAPSPVFTFYACENDTDEGGDGFVYQLDVPVAGVIEATLDDVGGDDVDVDVHLLERPLPEACLVRDDVAVAYAVEPGRYWIVVDTWVNGDGEVRAGPYTLTIGFVSDEAGSGPVGTFANPIAVPALPYQDARDTSAAPQSEIAAYSCAPETDEGGGEVVYRLGVPAPGVLRVALDDRPGDLRDVDVHLLDGPSADACLERANVELEHAVVAATTYWVVVDTWVDGDGAARAGPYTLSLDFTPDAAVGDAGTLANPVPVGALPFRDARSTAGAPSRALDAYACAPATDESGPEVVYALELAAPAMLVASVDDVVGDGVDVDLHLLTGSDAASCAMRANRSFTAILEAGSYRIVVDTWVDGSGVEKAGPYQLDLVAVTPPDLARGCIILYGDTRGDSSEDPQPAHQAVTAKVAARCAEATLVHTGDFVRSGTSASDWERFFAIEGGLHGSTRRLYPSRGNHDASWATLTGKLAPVLDEAFPEAQYVRLLAPRVWLIVLDSEGDAAAQAPFLRAALEDPARVGDRFVIAFHRPIYPSLGGHAGFAAGRDHWAPLFAAHAGRVLVVTGHNHGLSREEVDGVTYVTSAGGGAPLYGCGQVHGDTRYCANSNGYYVCDAALNCLGYEVDPESGSETLRDAFALP